jgi:hypothetical protein
VKTFQAKDPTDLARAIGTALSGEPDRAAAAALGASLTWERVFEDELANLKRLCP